MLHGHVLATLGGRDMKVPCRGVRARSVQARFGIGLVAGIQAFRLRSQDEFAPSKEFLARWPLRLSKMAMRPRAPCRCARTSPACWRNSSELTFRE